MKKQAGFTLVEIAIVMVIIGLLLGGVLKGQEIITNAKIKNLENDFNGTTAAIYSYQDRYRALPGDDPNASARFGTTVDKGDGSSRIEGDFDTTDADTEPRLFWLHLRNAGLVTGGTEEQQQPTNAFGGLTGVQSDAIGVAGLFVGFTQIPHDIALILESRADDGKPNAGSIRAALEGAATPSTDYSATNKDKVYDVYFSL